MNSQAKACRHCGKTVKGRSDKKFCDDFCRNSFNNQLKAADNNYVRNITNALKKNRRILMELLSDSEEMTRAPKEKLISAGFHFKYLTHTYTNKKGSTYFYCFEYGYLPLESDRLLIVRAQEER